MRLQRRALATASLGLFLALSGRQAAAPGAAARRGRRPGAGGRRRPDSMCGRRCRFKPSPWNAPNKPIRGSPNSARSTGGGEELDRDRGQRQPVPRRLHLHGPRREDAKEIPPGQSRWWIVQDGQIRFTIEGQEPFVAAKGFLVQVPHRNVYSMETIGDQPSLRFEGTVANSYTMYPIEETPTPVPGWEVCEGASRQRERPTTRRTCHLSTTTRNHRRKTETKKNQNQFAALTARTWHREHYRRQPQNAAAGTGRGQGPLHVTGPVPGHSGGPDGIQDRIAARPGCRPG